MVAPRNLDGTERGGGPASSMDQSRIAACAPVVLHDSTARIEGLNITGQPTTQRQNAVALRNHR